MNEAGEVARLLSCDPNTGDFVWKEKPGRGVVAGSVAGRLNRDGYREIGFHGRLIKAHRLAWLLTYGEWPQHEVDHINGNRADNRIENLRDVDRRLNSHNLRQPNRNNKTGFLGVHKAGNKYRASIVHRGHTKSLGVFDSAQEAHNAYMQAKRTFHEGCCE